MRTALLVCAVLAALLRPDGALAQPLPQQLSVVPRVGVLVQAVPFRQHWNDFAPEFRQVWHYRLEPAAVYGFVAEFGSGELPLRLRAEVNHLPSAGLRHLAEFYGPPLWEEAKPARAGFTTGTVAVLLEPEQACVRGFCPRLLLGGGGKYHRFDADVVSDDTVYPLAEDQLRPTLQLGVGLAARFRGVALVAEVNDFTNQVVFFRRDDPSGWVHDTLATLGVEVRLR